MRGTIGYVNGGDAIIVETTPERVELLTEIARQRNLECRQRGIPAYRSATDEPQEILDLMGWLGEDAIFWLLRGMLPEVVVYSGSDHGRALFLADGRSVQIKTAGRSYYRLMFYPRKPFVTQIAILCVWLRDLGRPLEVAVIGWVTPQIWLEHKSNFGDAGAGVMTQEEIREHGYPMLEGIRSELPREGFFVMEAEDLR
jgi:hypothetical protein